jgi:DNA primase
VDRHDLDTAEGRAAALDQGVPLVARIKDHSLRVEYAQLLARMVGVDDPDRVLARVRGIVRSGGRPEEPSRRPVTPAVDDAVVSVEREVLKVAMQLPAVAGPAFDALEPTAFVVPAHQAVRAAITAAGGTASAVTGPGWAAAVVAQLPDDEARSLVHALAVEPLHTVSGTPENYADVLLARLQEMVVARQVAALKSRVQRINPIEQADEHGRLWGELVALEMHRIRLRERAIGGL